MTDIQTFNSSERQCVENYSVCLARYIFIVLAIIFLGACATIAPPEIKPVTEGIFKEQPPKSPVSRIPSGPDVSLGVILSQNARASIAYLENYQELARSGFGNPILDKSLRDAYELTSDPEYVLNHIAKTLRNHFGSILVFEDLKSLQAAQPDILAIIDFHHVLLQFGSTSISAQVSLHFYDSGLRLIGESVGSGKAKFDSWNNTRGLAGHVNELYQKQHLPRVQALRQFDKSLASLMVAPVAGAASGKGYDQCMERVMRISDSELKLKMMAACDSAR